MPTSRIWRRSRNLARRDGWLGEHGVVGELVGDRGHGGDARFVAFVGGLFCDLKTFL